MKQVFNVVILLFITFIEVSLSAKQQVESREDAFAWFNKYGYNPCLNSSVQCSLSFTSLLKDIQKRFGLKVTGILDDPTKTQMNKPRCGNQDKPLASMSTAAGLQQPKWSRTSLTYSLRSYPTQIAQRNTENIIREAFKVWFDSIPLKIEEACSNCQADFVLDFARGDHSDTYPFDGSGGTLAHAFFPENGRVHFDKDEAWTERFDDANINLFLVAVHEIGHALGLDHSYDTKSIMYPSYQPMTKSNILPQFDRDSIQRLYGGKLSPSVTTTTRKPIATTTTPRKSITNAKSAVTVPTGKSHPRCRLFLDAAFNHPDGTLHTFNAGILWRYLPEQKTWDDRATTYKETYPQLPKQLAAGIYNSRTNEAIFFTKTDVYQYDIDHKNRAKYRSEHRLPKNLQNSIIGAIYYHNEIHVITGKNIRLFKLDNGYRLSDQRKLSDEFPRFTGTVMAAFSYRGLHHFFTDDRLVYIWSERLDTWETFAKPMETNWLACSGTEIFITKDVQVKKPSTHRHHHHHHHHHHDSRL